MYRDCAIMALARQQSSSLPGRKPVSMMVMKIIMMQFGLAHAAVNLLIPNFASNATFASHNVSISSNSTGNATSSALNSTASSTPAAMFIDNLEGFSRPNPLVNFYFIFLIFLFVFAYFGWRHFKKNRRTTKSKRASERRIAALRRDLEMAAATRTSPSLNTGHSEMSQLHHQQQPLPPPPYTADMPRPLDGAYLGGARLPIYADVILEQDETSDHDFFHGRPQSDSSSSVDNHRLV
ncbi:hypothetical protein V1514DRAFT_338738 [Lipomyces japonicus]|uniref:uncharacterized protein n=1 Tax=Lipomyces japonicus TaxID=56871 RepID=UPI0034CFBE3E